MSKKTDLESRGRLIFVASIILVALAITTLVFFVIATRYTKGLIDLQNTVLKLILISMGLLVFFTVIYVFIIYWGFSGVIDCLIHSKKKTSKISKLPEKERAIYNPSVLDPVGLSSLNHKRVKQVISTGEKVAEELAIDFVWMEGNGLLMSDQGKNYFDIYIAPNEGPGYSFFMQKVKEVRDFINAPKTLDNNRYVERFELRNNIFGRYKSEVVDQNK